MVLIPYKPIGVPFRERPAKSVKQYLDELDALWFTSTVHFYENKISFFKSGRDSIPFKKPLGTSSAAGYATLEDAKRWGRDLWKKKPGTFRELVIWNGKKIVFKADNFYPSKQSNNATQQQKETQVALAETTIRDFKSPEEIQAAKDLLTTMDANDVVAPVKRVRKKRAEIGGGEQGSERLIGA